MQCMEVIPQWLHSEHWLVLSDHVFSWFQTRVPLMRYWACSWTAAEWNWAPPWAEWRPSPKASAQRWELNSDSFSYKRQCKILLLMAPCTRIPDLYWYLVHFYLPQNVTLYTTGLFLSRLQWPHSFSYSHHSCQLSIKTDTAPVTTLSFTCIRPVGHCLCWTLFPWWSAVYWDMSRLQKETNTGLFFTE